MSEDDKARRKLLEYAKCLGRLSKTEFDDLLIILFPDVVPRDITAIRLAQKLASEPKLLSAVHELAELAVYEALCDCFNLVAKNGKETNIQPEEDLAGYWAKDKEDYIKIETTATIHEIREQFTKNPTVRIAVVLVENKAFGVITVSDVIAKDPKSTPLSTTAQQIMSTQLIHVSTKTHMTQVRQLIIEKEIGQVLVNDSSNNFEGVITQQEVLRWLNQQSNL